MDKLSVLYAFQYLWYVATGKILAQCLCKFFSCASLVGSCYFILFYFILLQMGEPLNKATRVSQCEPETM